MFWTIVFVLLFCWSSTPYASALTREESNTIAIYERVAPSVVNITTAVCEPEFFFCAVPDAVGSGSGIVLKEDGTIVTNHHVISGAQNIVVTLSDGRRMAAEVVASAPGDDIAIIRVPVGDRPLQAMALGDSNQLQIGEKVLAIGNPFGLGQTLTSGTVSMVGRALTNGNKTFRNLIQTDASINPGNSGGALVNSNGELVGMNTVILSPTGASIGIGFAIPVNHIKSVAPGLMHTRETKWLVWALAVLVILLIVRRLSRPGSPA